MGAFMTKIDNLATILEFLGHTLYIALYYAMTYGVIIAGTMQLLKTIL